MLNSYYANSQSLTMNAVSGKIVKTHPKSKIRHLHVDSRLADDLFGRDPSSIVLQVMLCDKDHVFVEIVDPKDFEEAEV